ncbi:DNA double-strand break repair rad50 ATPase [Paragonimus skrjabini miyazakii]|uniref:DNA double-strand break repair rad50 ATPase n=1 Tax=Paragonimus skrjabini miyazakii TaxID=59628 RepID=A0A8S9YK25_9TREM|nr:DNA double-strand break repair rad50 ATPase [Paragonimus skrjabini miyazakii]
MLTVPTHLQLQTEWFRTMDGQGSNTHKPVGFLDRFGQNDYHRKSRQREELAQEYECFKKMDEERFRNRFADKKANEKYYAVPKPTQVTPTQKTEKHPTDSAVTTRPEPSEYSQLEVKLYSKLDELTKKIELLSNPATSERTDETSKHPELETNSSDMKVTVEQMRKYEDILRDRLKSVHEAEERLTYLEMEYNTTKNSINTYQSTVSPKKRLNETSSFPVKLDSGWSGFLSDGQKDADRTKFERQQRYRKDLEMQILETQQRRKAEAESAKSAAPESHITKAHDNEPVARKAEDLHTPASEQALQAYSTPGEQEYFMTGKQDLLDNHAQAQHGSAFDNAQSILIPIRPTTDLSQLSGKDAKKAKYAQELRQQMEEARQKKELQKKRDEEYDRKIEEEFAKQNALYADPADSRVVGMRNSNGVLIDNDNREPKFARGGHGIFGSPLTLEQKTSSQKYKDELAKQMEEKRQKQEEEKRKELEEELREAERIAAEQMRLQVEYETEQARLKTKQREAELAVESERHQLEINQAIRRVEPKQVLHKHAPAQEHFKPKRKLVKSKASSKENDSNRDILIGPDTTIKKSKDPQFTSNKNIPYSNDKEQSAIAQLKNLRAQLELEKIRIEEALNRNRYTNEYDVGSTHQFIPEGSRSHPRVVRKGALLFNRSYQFDSGAKTKYGIGTVRETGPLSDWAKAAVHENSIDKLDEQQVAYLRAQDNYLNELKEDMDILNLKELLNDTRLERQKSITWNEAEKEQDHMIDRIVPIDLKSTSPSQKSINIEELDAKNQQRLKRLEAIQLLNDIDTDPEAVLQRFVAKHDAVFPRNAKQF